MNQTGNTLNDVVYTDQKNVKIIDNYLEREFTVSQNEYDVVLSFFKKVMKDPAAAENFTISIYLVSRQTQIPVLELIKELKNQDSIQMTASIAYYINGIRSSKTLLGVTNLIAPNWTAARNVVI